MDDYEKEMEEIIKKRIEKQEKLEKIIPIILSFIFASIALAGGNHTFDYFESLGGVFFWAIIIALVIAYFFKPVLIGEVYVVGITNMENYLAISFGFFMVFYSSGFATWALLENKQVILTIAIFHIAIGMALLYKGFKDGPIYGWFG